MAATGGSLKATVLGSVAAVLGLLNFAAPSGAAVQPCNGHPSLCSRTLDRVVLPGTHNSMSTEELGWNAPNQTYSIPGQLRRGARAFLIDTFYGRVNPSTGKVENLSTLEGSQTGADVYLCHYSCVGGSSLLEDVFSEVRDFLEENPREILIFVNEDYVTADDFAGAVEDSGLIDYAYEGPTGPWPTLGEMIASDDRVLFLAQDDAAGVPWYHRAYAGPMMETPYSFSDLEIDQLTSPSLQEESCREERGGSQAGLFLMNHWVLGNNVVPVKELAEVTNQKSVLVSRARACERARGKLPTILAVDFFGTGDVIGAALELNGLGFTRPRLTPAQIRKRARAACRRKKGRARAACIRTQTARLKKMNAAAGT